MLIYLGNIFEESNLEVKTNTRYIIDFYLLNYKQIKSHMKSNDSMI